MVFRYASALLVALAAMALGPVRGAWAQSALPASDLARIEVLPGWQTTRGTRMAGIRITLAEGWKTYWRAPGEAGIPPSFDWSGSDNLGKIAIHWPTPAVFEANGLRSIGYKHSVVIPIELTPSRDAAGPIRLQGKMAIGVCKDICVPVSASLDAIIPAPGPDNREIRASLADQPASAREAGVRSARCAVSPTRDGLALTIRIAVPPLGRHETAAVELADRSIWVAEPETERAGNILIAQTELVPTSGAPFVLDRKDIRTTILADGKAIDIQGCTGG